MPNPHCLPFSGCSGIIVPLCGLTPLKRSAESPEIECLLSKWDVRFSGARIGLTDRSEAHCWLCWEMRGEVDLLDRPGMD